MIEIKTRRGVILGMHVNTCQECPCGDMGDDGWGAYCKLANSMGRKYISITYSDKDDPDAIPKNCPLDDSTMEVEQ